MDLVAAFFVRFFFWALEIDPEAEASVAVTMPVFAG